MSSLEIVLGEDWKDDVRYLSELRPYRPADAPLNLVEIRDIIDLVVDGNNLTACVDQESVFGLIAKLVEALVVLGEGHTPKTIIEFPSEPFEFVVVPDRDTFLLSLYSVDRTRKVVAHDVSVPAQAFVSAVSQAAESLLSDLLNIDERFSADSFIRAFSADLSILKRRKEWSFPEGVSRVAPPLRGSVSSQRGLTLSFHLSDTSAAVAYEGEPVFDLHSLLLPGVMHCEVGQRQVVLSEAYPVLAVQALMRRTRELLNLLEANRREFQCESDLHHARFDVEAHGASWSIRFGRFNATTWIATETTPAECLDVVISLAEQVIADILGAAPSIQMNQRFADLGQDVADLRSWFEDLSETNKYLERPEVYLASHEGVHPDRTDDDEATFAWPFSSVRALYPTRKWTFRTPRIHFAAMTHAGRRILVPTTEALIAVDSATGEESWSASERDGARLSSYAQAGEYVILANERADLWLVRLDDGTDIAKIGADASGTLLLDAANYPGSNLAVVADFHGQVTGFIPTTGEVVWSYGAGHGYLTGVAFEGPIVCTLSSPGFLQALDPLNGKLLWKVRLGGVSDSGPHAYNERIYTFSHDPMTRLVSVHAFHPFTGRAAWQVRLEGWLAGSPNFLDDWLVVPVERNGRVQLVGIPLNEFDSAPEWTVDLTSAGLDRPTRVVAVEIDGVRHGIVRTDRAEITCFELATGDVRWRTRGEGDQALLFRNLDLLVVRDSIMTVGDCIELRSSQDGSVLHTFGDVLEAPEYLSAMGNLTVLIGEPGSAEDGDQLMCLTLEHFLAVVGD